MTVSLKIVETVLKTMNNGSEEMTAEFFKCGPMKLIEMLSVLFNLYVNLEPIPLHGNQYESPKFIRYSQQSVWENTQKIEEEYSPHDKEEQVAFNIINH